MRKQRAKSLEIKNYQLHWDFNGKVDEIILYSTDPEHGVFLASLHIDNPEEFAAVADMLGKERPLWFDPETQTLCAGHGADDLRTVSDEETVSECGLESTSTSLAEV